MIFSQTQAPSRTQAFTLHLTKPAITATAQDVTELRNTLAQKRVVLVTGVPSSRRHQLHITQMLGDLYATRRAQLRRKWRPELRTETDARPNPYNRIWHSDTSWAVRPARYTLLYCLAAEDGTATTELADMMAGFEAIPQEQAREISSWRALHHVERSRQLRFPLNEPVPSHLPPKRPLTERLADRLSVGSSHARTLPIPPPPGVEHPVIATEPYSGRRYVYLGEHAYKISHLDQPRSLTELSALTQLCTQATQTHTWQTGDLLIFDNWTFLHRRGMEALGERTLRRTLALR